MQRKMRNKRTREEQREDWIEHKAGKRYKVVYTSRGIGPVPIPRQITRRTKFNPKLKSTLKRIFYNVYVTRGYRLKFILCPVSEQEEKEKRRKRSACRRRRYHVSCEPIFVTRSYRRWRSGPSRGGKAQRRWHGLGHERQEEEESTRATSTGISGSY